MAVFAKVTVFLYFLTLGNRVRVCLGYRYLYNSSCILYSRVYIWEDFRRIIKWHAYSNISRPTLVDTCNSIGICIYHIIFKHIICALNYYYVYVNSITIQLYDCMYAFFRIITYNITGNFICMLHFIPIIVLLRKCLHCLSFRIVTWNVYMYKHYLVCC